MADELELSFFNIDDLRKWERDGVPAGTSKPLLAVLGCPVAHSLSPPMMIPALKSIRKRGTYIRIHAEPDEFETVVRMLPGLGFLGANITIPHKLAALQIVDKLDPAAEKFGSVNTIVVEKDKTLTGYNSDGPGFLRAVKEVFDVNLKDMRVIVLGAGGGAGRAAAIQSAKVRCKKLVLVNRTQMKADQLRDHLTGVMAASKIKVIPWDVEAIAKSLKFVDLIVNGTSVGMKRKDPPLLPYDSLDESHKVFDMIYKPLRTPLVAAAEKRGATAVNGLPMLLHQGVISFQKWFPDKDPVDAMRTGLHTAVGMNQQI